MNPHKIERYALTAYIWIMSTLLVLTFIAVAVATVLAARGVIPW